jgi:hypothetical protein
MFLGLSRRRHLECGSVEVNEAAGAVDDEGSR